MHLKRLLRQTLTSTCRDDHDVSLGEVAAAAAAASIYHLPPPASLTKTVNTYSALINITSGAAGMSTHRNADSQ